MVRDGRELRKAKDTQLQRAKGGIYARRKNWDIINRFGGPWG